MSDLDKILLTSALTVAGGVLVYIVGQIITRFLVDPLNDLKKLIGEIADAMIYNANVILNARTVNLPPADISRAQCELRAKASALRVRAFSLPLLDFFASCGVIPRRDSLEQAAENLIGLSNSFPAVGTTSDQIDCRVRAIEQALKLPRLM